MSDGLSSYIQQGQPQEVVADEAVGQVGGPPPAEVVTSGVDGEPSSGVSGSTDQSGSPSPADQGVTTPDPRDEAIRQLQEQLYAQAQATNQLRQQQAAESARREEAQIMAQIQAIPDEDERRTAYYNYRASHDASVIQAQQAQLSAVYREKEQSNQEVARNSVVTIRALQEGIPTEYIPFLKKSDTPEELEQHLQLLKQSLGQGLAQQHQATRQEIVDSGVYAAGGAQTGFVPPEMPQEHSGDLAGLIAATPPRFS